MGATAEKIPVTNDSKKSGSFFSKKDRSDRLFFQPKLSIGAIDDPLEREADAVAEKIIGKTDNVSDSLTNVFPIVQKKCSQCQEDEIQRQEGEEEPATTSSTSSPEISLSLSSNDFLHPAIGPDFLSMRRPFLDRGVGYLWQGDSALQVWNYNFNFFSRLGLAPTTATTLSNFTTPRFIDSQLRASNPTWWEITDRELNTSTIGGSIPLLEFTPDFRPVAPTWFRSIFGGGGSVIQRKCAQCEDEEKLQRKEDGEKSDQQSEAPSIVADVLASGGTPLENNSRSFMESRFGYDFSKVKIHTDTVAAKSAKSINAMAYTLGNNIVFNEGQYAPGTENGKRLLAHELTHVVQQSNSIQPKLIQRNIHPPTRTDCTAVDDFIRLIVVNQESSQSVTIFWNYSGNTETAMCSTGRGTCCVDSTAADDIVGAQQAGSTQNGSHWTPIGVKSVAKIINLGADDMRRYWTEFDDPRDIALHAYDPVDGTPLSHGCVRMSVDMARTIYCGSIIGRTRVEVRGFARPRCDNTTLQAEWAADGITSIPRCTAHSGLSTEVERLQRVNPSQLNSTVVNSFRINLGRSTTLAEATTAARTAGTDLWTASHGTISGQTVTVDDRPLYWTRNFITRELQEWNPVFTVSAANRAAIINTFELASRGQDITTFRTVPTGVKRILITGFDPFGMDSGFGRTGAASGMSVGNTSGAIVLALDGQTILGTNCSAMVQGAVFPVRYADFDLGIVENYVRNFISGGNAVDMIMTISRNRDDGIFELERFAGRARGAHTDNAGQTGSQSALDQSLTRIHPGSTRTDEFRESTLPRSGMRSGSTVVRDDTYSGHLPDGTSVSNTTNATPPANAISEQGSGGDFLSNEIFYRVSMLQLNQQTNIPMGHLHVPAGTQAEYQGIVNTVRQIITRALNNSLCATPQSTQQST
jgi:pyrrolidone-carboxylate peptidase